MAEFFDSFFPSAAYLRMGLGLVLLIYTLVVTREYKVPFSIGLRIIPLVLIAKDLISYFINFPLVHYLGDGIVLAIYSLWLLRYNNHRKTTTTFILLIIGIPTTFQLIGLFLPGFTMANGLSSVALLAGAVWFALLMNDITVYNSKNAEFIIHNKYIIFSLIIASKILIIFDSGFQSNFIQYVGLFLSYAPYFFILYRYTLYFNRGFKEREQFNTSYIDSLFDFMQTIGTAMSERIEVKAVLEYVMRAIISYTDAEAGLVMLRDSHEELLRISCSEGYFPPPFPIPPIVKAKLSGIETYFASTPIKVGETVLGECAQKNEPIFVPYSTEDSRLNENTKDDTLFISSLIVVPLVVNKEVFGVVSVVHRQRDQFFTNLDYERCKVFVEYASLTLDNLYNYAQMLEKQEIEREVNIAAEIQKKLLPNRIPKKLQKSIAAFSTPAKGVSGDYYDIIPLNREGKLAIIICDVAGKGVPASLIMVMIRTIVHLIAPSTKDASKVVSWINRGIAGRIDIERFATLSYFTYDPPSQTIEYSNAAHHPLMILRGDSGKIELLDSPGLPIGLERDAKYERKMVKLSPGDAVMLYTDGIVEAMNSDGEQYEEDRLKEVFISNAQLNAPELISKIQENIAKYVGAAKQHDDQTLIVLKA